MKSDLDKYYSLLSEIVLSSQSGTTGLIGDHKVGYVRDTVYSGNTRL